MESAAAEGLRGKLDDMSKSIVGYLNCRFAMHLDDMQWPCTGEELAPLFSAKS